MSHGAAMLAGVFGTLATMRALDPSVYFGQPMFFAACAVVLVIAAGVFQDQGES